MPLTDDDEPTRVVSADLPACPRCGAAHKGLPVTDLANAGEVVYAWYTTCPDKKQPVLIAALDPPLEGGARE